MCEKSLKIFKYILLCGTVLAAIKMIFFDYTMDEEYQIMMAYRNLQGDRLFGEMWEPHQTSAFLCIGFMWFYHLITGTYTGVILFLRVVTTLIQVLLSVTTYKVLKQFLGKEMSFWVALIQFNVVPKAIQIPEFANMQTWFFIISVLCLMQYYGTEGAGKRKSLVFVAGLSMALEVLAYPSCLFLFPFFIVALFLLSGKEKWKDILLFTGACALSAIVWLAIVLRRVPFKEFIGNLQNVISFDLTHNLTGVTEDKSKWFLPDLLYYFMLLGIVFGIGIVLYLCLYRKKKDLSKVLFCCAIASFGMQFFYWTFLKSGYEKPQIHLLVLWIVGIISYCKLKQKPKYLLIGMLGSLISLFAVSYISDLAIYYSLPHGFLGALFAAVCLCLWMEEKDLNQGKKYSRFLLLGLCFVCTWGKGFTLREGRDYNTVLETKGIMKSGPAIGILSDYMNVYIYNSNAEDFKSYIQKEDKVLIVTNMVFSAGTTPYMFGDYEVCHYSIVDPTAYDERLLAYWELYPEKQPNVIVVDCWYGSLQEDPSNFIMQYIENEFGYKESFDGKYVRIYKK